MLSLVWQILTDPLAFLVPITNFLGGWSYFVLFLVIFLESALIEFAFLPGQSLLFMSSSIAANQGSFLNIWLLLFIFIVAGTTGAMLKYKLTQRLVNKRQFAKRLTTNSSTVAETEAAFDHHETRSLVIGRFIPIFGLFVPVVAGTVNMDWHKFNLWNFVGVLLWVGACCFLGYYFGDKPFVQRNFTWIFLLLIIVPVIGRSLYTRLIRNHTSRFNA